MHELEFVDNKETFYNYTLSAYRPVKKHAGKLRISNVLFNSYKNNTLKDSFNKIVPELRSYLGINQSVWAIKNFEGKIEWEFYFYRNYQKHKLTLAGLCNIFKNHFKIEDFTIDENWPYTCLSLDLNDSQHIKSVDVYFYRQISPFWSGFSHKITSNQSEFKNYYEQISPEKTKDIHHLIYSSSFVNSNTDTSKILLSELIKCNSICIAYKKNANSIYFSGINIEQFIFFLRKFNYPDELINFVNTNKDKLDYILFDVGFDYLMDNNKVIYKKSVIYGTI